MSKRRNLDGVASLRGFLAKAGDDLDATPSSQSKAQIKKKAAFDPRAEDSDSESEPASNSDSDSDGALPDPASWNRLNKSTSTPTSQKGIAPSKRTPRSNEEEVADSDDGRDSKQNKKVVVKKAPSSSSDSSSGSSSEPPASSDSSDSEDEAPAKKNIKTTPSKKEEDTSSSDSSSPAASGSDSDSDSGSDDNAYSKKAAKSLMNGKAAPSKKAASTSSSASSSASGSESEAEEPTKKSKKARTKKTAPKEETPEESSGSEESEAEEPTSAVETEKEAEKVAEPLAVAPQPKKTATNGFQGENFVLRPVQGDEDGKDVQDFFAQARREGKQLWYFTAPASVPINVIEQLEIPIHKIRNGEPVFKHDGGDYGVNVSNEVANPTYQVLIPNKKGVRYEPLAQNVDQVMRIKRIIQVPSPANAEVATLPLASSKGARPQPKGLKARYHPIGVPADEDMGRIGSESGVEAEDVEMTQAPEAPSSSQKSSKKASTTTKKAKRKAAEVDEDAASSQLVGEEEAALKKKKSKKQKRSAEDTPTSTPAAASQELHTPSQPELPAPKSGKKAKKAALAAPSSSQVSKKETPILPPAVPHRASVSSPIVKKEKKSKSSSATPKPKLKQERPPSP
ncbi:hypothetical protein VDGD_00812 [Verticillium dahliae]|nr:hypothetical protein VDGD_00812 [Verticillium dahliae]